MDDERDVQMLEMVGDENADLEMAEQTVEERISYLKTPKDPVDVGAALAQGRQIADDLIAFYSEEYRKRAFTSKIPGLLVRNN
jgi:hypothetical protein